LFQSQLAAVGIRLKIEGNTWPSFLKKVEEGRTEIWGIGWGADYPDPENFLMLLYGPNAAPAGANAARFQNDEYDGLFEQINGALDTPERRQRIRRMVEIACEEAPWIFDLHRESWVLHQPWCKNYKYPVIGGGYFKYIRIAPRK
jgi:ABC-type transport system substrate-binding protein